MFWLSLKIGPFLKLVQYSTELDCEDRIQEKQPLKRFCKAELRTGKLHSFIVLDGVPGESADLEGVLGYGSPSTFML